MRRHPILVGIDGDGMHGELMGRTEYADRDFLWQSVGDRVIGCDYEGTHTAIGDQDFC